MIKRSENNIDILFPLDGIMLTDAAGERIGDTLKINARVQARDGRNFTINGQPLPNLWHGTYRADIILDKYENKVVVRDEDTGETETVTVYFLKKGFKKYRFSLDDNIWFLQNLTENQDKYESMFEDPYLALLKTMHEKYGTKFHVNIYYETDRHGGWNISQIPVNPHIICNNLIKTFQIDPSFIKSISMKVSGNRTILYRIII